MRHIMRQSILITQQQNLVAQPHYKIVFVVWPRANLMCRNLIPRDKNLLLCDKILLMHDHAALLWGLTILSRGHPKL